MKYKRKVGKKTIQSKKGWYDGIQFASQLEVYMYKILKEANVEMGYETERFDILEGFYSSNVSFERTAKKDFIDRGQKKVRGIYYTPDFVSDRFIIETKGRANESFPIRWKLFKRHLDLTGDYRVVYKPQSKADCDVVLKDILKRFY
tara:strand:- start:5843 stop:6283 length:441 start_codon:yes stop_codon:yes gene_type:complete